MTKLEHERLKLISLGKEKYLKAMNDLALAVKVELDLESPRHGGEKLQLETGRILIDVNRMSVLQPEIVNEEFHIWTHGKLDIKTRMSQWRLSVDEKTTNFLCETSYETNETFVLFPVPPFLKEGQYQATTGIPKITADIRDFLVMPLCFHIMADRYDDIKKYIAREEYEDSLYQARLAQEKIQALNQL